MTRIVRTSRANLYAWRKGENRSGSPISYGGCAIHVRVRDHTRCLSLEMSRRPVSTFAGEFRLVTWRTSNGSDKRLPKSKRYVVLKVLL